MYIGNNVGPDTVPCGTPNLTSWPSLMTLYILLSTTKVATERKLKPHHENHTTQVSAKVVHDTLCQWPLVYPKTQQQAAWSSQIYHMGISKGQCTRTILANVLQTND